MTTYGTHASKNATHQKDQAREDQVLNNAGGFVFALDKWKQLDRFLILGAEGGTYYVDEKKHVQKNVKSLEACIREDGPRTVARIVEISDAGRAPKNDPALFALAVCAGSNNPVTRRAALDALPKVARIGTHLFHFVADVEGQRRWGRSLRTAVAKWYTAKTADQVAFQAVKYQQRDGWSHRDVLRLAHPHAPSAAHNATFRWITGGRDGLDAPTKKGREMSAELLPEIIRAFDEIMRPGVDVNRAVNLIVQHGLPHECVPNELKGNAKIWEAMLPNMGVTAVIRNLAKMTSVGLLGPMSNGTRSVVEMLGNREVLKKGRVHPISVLFAMKTYGGGHGLKGSLVWTPQREIVDALDEAFYQTFDLIEPTGKRHLLALDISASMAGALVQNTTLSARDVTAAMAMVTARSESAWHCMGFSNTFIPLAISPKQRLDDVIAKISGLPFASTDCSLPMLYASANKIPVDAFVVYTDNETYAGTPHPFQALKNYRQQTGINAKLIVVGTDANPFIIADPSDAGMLDVCGFDTAVPAIMADFVRGDLENVDTKKAVS